MDFFRYVLLVLLTLASLSAKEYDWQPFKPVVRPEVPTAGNGWAKNDIDRFVAARQQTLNLSHRPEASKGIWLRRVHLDLTGLAPTPLEQAEFLDDDSPDAYETVVDKLLASPAYGERWGRHWMDVWRYSDWAGYKNELRDSQRHIWHWRDWIVESLNQDKGYDQMLREMLAADELYPEDTQTIRATGYLARQYFRNRDQWMDNVVTHTAQGFLGITLGCAKCHEHKYDGFTMEDYYAFRAIFESYQVRTDRVPGELDTLKLGMPRAYDSSISAKTYLFDKGDERHPLKDKEIVPGIPALFKGKYAPKNLTLPNAAYQPHRRPFVLDGLRDEARGKLAEATTCIEKEAAGKNLEALEALLAIEAIEGSGKKDSEEWKAAATQLVRLQRESKLADAKAKVETAVLTKDQTEGEFLKAKDGKDKAAIAKSKRAMDAAIKSWKDAEKALATAQKAMEAKLDSKYTAREGKTYSKLSSGRRSALAEWLTGRENPLAARVAANHIWLRHFGQAIVPTVNEFGSFGKKPSHPALLDWLAAEFMETDWSMKSLHKLIVLSATYRQSSASDERNAAIDPDNTYLWKMPTRRMEGEIVRDNLLHLAGTLDREMSGPDIPNTEAQTSKRRSIYLRHAHEKLVEFVQIFDGPKVTECYQRDQTVQPHQALALANSRLTFDQAKTLARKMDKQCGQDDGKFVNQAFRWILARMPTQEEQALCREYLAKENTRKNLLMVLFNHNDFVTIR